MEKIDIHNTARRYELALEKLEKSRLSPRNKDFIRRYDQICILEKKVKSTRSYILNQLRRFCLNFIDKDLNKLTAEELRNILIRVEQKDYSPWTKQGLKTTLKKFFKWLTYGDDYMLRLDYPPICSWINTGMSKKEMGLIRASDLLTESDIENLIEAADNPRDKALVSTLYELGARVAEHGNRQIKDIVRDDFGYIIDLDGKTGRRSPRIVMSAPYLTTWLNIHPMRKNPEAPLWVITFGASKGKHLKYCAIRKLLRRLLEKTAIQKRIHPHLFRHSRATHCLANGWMNEAQCKVYFGWTPDSAMLSRYAHLTCEDANKAVLKMNGIETGRKKDSVLMTKQCPNCKAINEPGAKFCNKCTYILDVKTAVEIDETRRKADDQLTMILQKHPEIVKQIAELLNQ